MAALEHSAIVSLYDFGEADGWLYLVMRYMPGGTLRDRIARRPLSPQEAHHVVRRIGGALDEAHRSGVIHRDLKPANILLDEDQEPYLSDFGIVKVATGGDEEYLTQTGQTLGTFAYMSPEQLLGKDLDGRSDVYALGIVLYEMLTGEHPFADATYQFYEVRRPWLEDEVSWSSAGSGDSWQVPGIKGAEDRDATSLGELAPDENGPFEVELNADALAVVQGWVDDPESNHGFVITGTDSRDGVDFRCSEYESPLERPLLTLTYVSSDQ